MKLSIPHIDKNDVNSVKKNLKSGWISNSSKTVVKFENKINDYCGSKYSIALNSGTSAIHLALKIIGVNTSSEIIVPSLTFIATVNPILYQGATPIIFDVNNQHNLKTEDVIKFINENTIFKNKKTINKISKKIIKAIIVTHMWGRACNFEDLKTLCKKKNIFIIEDAAEALGSFVKLKKSRHCGTIGDIGCLSFNANKIITTGSGGALLTNNKKFFDRAQYLSNQAKDDSFNYVHNECGYNYKMNGISASLGISQLKKLSKKIIKRKKIYERYLFNFKSQKDIEILSHNFNSKNNYWMNVISFKKLNYNQTKKISMYLSKKNIETRRVWRPLNLQSYLKQFKTYNIINALKFYSNSLCIPSDEQILISDIDKISEHILKIYEIIYNNYFKS